jgi:hypothetical protein
VKVRDPDRSADLIGADGARRDCALDYSCVMCTRYLHASAYEDHDVFFFVAAPPRERKDSHTAHALDAFSFRAKQATEAAAAKVAVKTVASLSPSSAGSSKSGRVSPTGSGSTSATSLFGSSVAQSHVETQGRLVRPFTWPLSS